MLYTLYRKCTLIEGGNCLQFIMHSTMANMPAIMFFKTT